MTGHPRISVVVPVYNRAELVQRALRSVFAQTFADFELIVVDDGSADDMEKALEQFSDPRLRLLRHERNRGTAAARNTGIREARGAYVAFLDSDDEWLPEMLERQHAPLEASRPECSLALTGFYLARDHLGRCELRPLLDSADWYLRLLAGCNVSLGSCALVRRAALDEIGVFDERMRRFEDWDWLLRYTLKYPIASIEEPLALIHSGAGWPSVEAVERAVEQMWERHEATAAGHSAAARRLLFSTLCYERAAALHRARRPLAAVAPLFRSILIYPSRGLGFYRHLLRRAADLSSGRFG